MVAKVGSKWSHTEKYAQTAQVSPTPHTWQFSDYVRHQFTHKSHAQTVSSAGCVRLWPSRSSPSSQCSLAPSPTFSSHFFLGVYDCIYLHRHHHHLQLYTRLLLLTILSKTHTQTDKQGLLVDTLLLLASLHSSTSTFVARARSVSAVTFQWDARWSWPALMTTPICPVDYLDTQLKAEWESCTHWLFNHYCTTQ